MNKTIKTFVLWLFVILLSVSFIAYFGLTGNSFTPGVQVIGTVNGYPIENRRASQFTETLRSLQNYYQAQGVDLSQYGQALVSEAFRATVINHLIVKSAQDNRIAVSDEDVLREIREEYFRGDNAEFNSFIKTGEPAIKRSLEELIRNNLVQEYFEDVYRANFYTTNQLVQKINTAARQREALVAMIDLNSEAESSVTTEILKQYYEANQDRYVNATNTTFEQSQQNVISDYLLENRESLVANVQNNLSQQFGSISNTLNEDAFRQLALENNMFVVGTQAFNFYSRAILDDQGGRQPIINDANTIRKLFLLPVGGMSELLPLSSGTRNLVIVIYILDENVLDNPSSFVVRSYATDLQKEVGESVLTSLYSSLYENAEVIVNQAPQEPQ